MLVQRLIIPLFFVTLVSQATTETTSEQCQNPLRKNFHEIVNDIEMASRAVKGAFKPEEKIEPGTLAEARFTEVYVASTRRTEIRPLSGAATALVDRRSFPYKGDALVKVVEDRGDQVLVSPILNTAYSREHGPLLFETFLFSRMDLTKVGATISQVRENLMNELFAPDKKWSVGQKVRYRDHAGILKVGMIARIRDDKGDAIFTEAKADGKPQSVKVKFNEIFALDPTADESIISTPGFPKTPDVPVTPRSEALRRLLNRVAELSSYPEWSALPLEKKAIILIRIVQTFLPERESAVNPTRSGLYSMDDLLRVGVGTSLYSAPVLAMMFRESGIPAEVMEVEDPEEEDFMRAVRSWVEVPTSGGRLIVDPFAGLVGQEEELRSPDFHSDLGQKFYLNPEKVRVTEGP